MSRCLPLTGSILAISIAVASATGCRSGATRTGPANAPAIEALGCTTPSGALNVLVITLDTTRADRLGAYGGTVATPNLDRLAHDGVVFERAYTAAPLTLPAHTSIFTGQYPPGHGVRDNGGFFVADDAVTLAERLKAAGFATGGFVGAYVLDRRWGIGQGFDTYVDEFDVARAGARPIAEIERRGDVVADRTLAWLRQVETSRFFAWVHFYDPHTPYNPPEPFATGYAGRPYDGEVAFVDAQVGRIVDELQRSGQLERTLIVVAGDHGESLGEHGESTHGFFVYDATIHVPMIMRAPCAAMRGKRVSQVVRTVDVVPTVLEMVGAPAATGLDGTSVVELLGGSAAAAAPRPAYAEALYPRLHFGWSELRALVADRFKYIEAPRPELYDLAADPGEAQNLHGTRAALVAGLARDLGQVAARVDAAEGARAKASLDPDARERLAALGYIGSAPAAPPRAGADRSDPKDKVAVFDGLTRAWELLRDEHGSPEAASLLRAVVHGDATVTDAWFMLGTEAALRGNHGEALEHFRKALALNPEYDLVVRALAKSYRALGRDGDALAGYERLIALDPRNAFARHEMAEILIDQRRFAEARQQLEAAVASTPTLAVARTSLGAVLLELGDTPGAERELRTAAQQRPDLPLVHFNLALIAESRGDVAGATAEYQAELERNAGSYRAAFNLGRLYDKTGNRTAAQSAYRQAIAINAKFAEGHLFLAKSILDEGRDLAQAASLATRGLALGPRPDMAPLGHFVLADVYTRQGRTADAARESAAGRALQRRAATASPR